VGFDLRLGIVDPLMPRMLNKYQDINQSKINQPTIATDNRHAKSTKHIDGFEQWLFTIIYIGANIPNCQ
jgi:hypothetical protein